MPAEKSVSSCRASNESTAATYWSERTTATPLAYGSAQCTSVTPAAAARVCSSSRAPSGVIGPRLASWATSPAQRAAALETTKDDHTT